MHKFQFLRTKQKQNETKQNKITVLAPISSLGAEHIPTNMTKKKIHFWNSWAKVDDLTYF